MATSERTPWRVVDVDAALDTIQAAREEAIAQLAAGEQAQRLALLADAEAACWEQVFDQARTRAHWRAALAAREWAQLRARIYRRSAADAAAVEVAHRALARPVATSATR